MIKLYNEDCLEGMKKIPDGSVDMILTDLPQGITDAPFDKRLPFEPMWQEFWRVCKPNAAIVLFSVGKFTIELAASQLEYYRYEWIWCKTLPSGFLNAKKMPLKAHEDILVFYRKLPTYNPQVTKEPYPRDTIVCNNPPIANQIYYLQQKPTALLEYLIRTYTNEGETVLDATMGSGSTGVAAIKSGRNFIGFETETKFYEIAEKRINETLDKRGLFYWGTADTRIIPRP